MSDGDPLYAPLIDDTYISTYRTIFYALTGVSLFTNVVVIAIHSCMVYYKVADFNRVTLRLTVAACIFGAIRGIVRLAMTMPADTLYCLVDSFFLAWSELASPLCIAFVGIHAVLVLVFNVDHPRKYEKYYYIIIMVYSLLVSIVNTSFRDHTFLGNYTCWVRFYFGKKANAHFAWAWYYIFLIIPIFISVMCALVLLVRYKMERHNFVATSVRYSKNKNHYLIPTIPMREHHVDPIKTFRNVVIRLTGYAIVPLFSKIFLLISGFKNLLGHPANYYTLVVGGVVVNLQGFLISILYYSDPAMTGTIRRLFRYLRKAYVDDYPSNKRIDEGSLNKDDQDNINLDSPPDNQQLDSECRPMNVRFGRSNHDMIADEVSINRFYLGRPTTKNSDKSKRRYDPYRYHCVAATMHWFMTKICRLKPHMDPSTSSSTLSYLTKSLSSAVLTQNSLIAEVDRGHELKGDDNINKSFLAPGDDLLKVSTTNHSRTSSEEGNHAVSHSPIASLRLMRPSKKISQVIRQHSSQQQPSDLSLHDTVSPNSSLVPSEEHIDRLSLLSGSIEPTRPNVDFTPLDAPPHHAAVPSLSITLPDQPWPSSPPRPMTCASPKSPTSSPHGVAMDPTSVYGLLDYEPTNPFHPARHDPLLIVPDGLGNGWTSLIHLQQAWVEDNRMVVSVQHWVKGYLGSRWFVAE